MTTEELEKIVARHEMQCLELKEPLLGIGPAELGALKKTKSVRQRAGIGK